MLTVYDIINSKKSKQRKPDKEELRKLPDRKALIHGRLSGFSQVKESKESVREIAALVDKAIEDGYQTSLDYGKVKLWLEDIQSGVSKPGILADGEVIVNCLGLGISGSLPVDKRPDLIYDTELLKDDKLGAIYVTEGANRLSRDPDRVVSAMLLKLMKESNCKLRTSYEILSPCIERDWEIIHEELEQGAEELTRMNKRLFQRKARKADRGEYVGEPIPPGYIIPVIGQGVDGKYEFGKMELYPAHAEIDKRILREYVNQEGSALRTVWALGDLTFPFFPPELSYMEKRSALRGCRKTPTGYRITPALVQGLATNLKHTGTWVWGNCEPKLNNHEPVVPQELWLQAYELAARPGKPKGKAVKFEPLEWAGLLWCTNGSQSRLVSSHSADERYVCDYDYKTGRGPICLDISARFIDEPLTTELLRQLDFMPFAEEVLSALEADATEEKLEESRRKREEVSIQQSIQRWQVLFHGCVDIRTGQIDRDREGFYWDQITAAQAKLEELKSRPIPKKHTAIANFRKVRDFLADLPHNWRSYTRTVRNRLLKLLVEKVELCHSRECIEATIIWKTGFEQRITICRPIVRSGRDMRWTQEEDKLLTVLYPSSSTDVVLAAFPNRSWNAISARAFKLALRRERQYHPPQDWRPWTPQEDEKLRASYEAGIALLEIARELDRSINAIETRAAAKMLVRPRSVRWKEAKVRWQVHNLEPIHEASLGR